MSKILQFDSNNDDDSHFTTPEFSPYSTINLNCSYLDINSISEISNANLSILSLNIQSLPAKYNEFTDLISNLSALNFSPDFLCLQEIWQLPDPSLFPLTNYQNIVINSRNTARGGGVGIYVKNDIVFANLPQYSIFSERIFESIFIEVSSEDNKKFVIGSVYRPGTSYPGLTFKEQFSQFTEILSGILAELGTKYDNVFIVGDFNLDLIKINENKYVAEYIDTLLAFGFLQLITKPTRIANNSASLIDHVLTNSSCELYDSYILCSCISDHFPIIHNINFKKPKCKPDRVESRNFSIMNINRFKTALTNYNWNHVLSENNCPQLAYTNFITTFNSLIDVFFPVTQIKFNSNIHRIEPWMTTGILISRRRKNYLCKQHLKNPTVLSRNNFKNFRNIYNNIIRTAKKNFFHSQIEANSNNLRKTWQLLSSAIRKNNFKKAAFHP